MPLKEITVTRVTVDTSEQLRGGVVLLGAVHFDLLHCHLIHFYLDQREYLTMLHV